MNEQTIDSIENIRLVRKNNYNGTYGCPIITLEYDIVLISVHPEKNYEVTETVAGTLRILKYNAATDRCFFGNIGAYESFDLTDSRNIAQYGDWIFDTQGNFLNHIRKQINQRNLETYQNLIVLDRIEIKEEFRGIRLSHIATVLVLQENASQFDIVYLKAFPLQHEGAGDTDTKGFKKDEAKLIKLYKGFGLNRCGYSPEFVGFAENVFERFIRLSEDNDSIVY